MDLSHNFYCILHWHPGWPMYQFGREENVAICLLLIHRLDTLHTWRSKLLSIFHSEVKEEPWLVLLWVAWIHLLSRQELFFRDHLLYFMTNLHIFSRLRDGAHHILLAWWLKRSSIEVMTYDIQWDLWRGCWYVRQCLFFHHLQRWWPLRYLNFTDI